MSQSPYSFQNTSGLETNDRYIPRATGGQNGQWAIWDRQLNRFVEDAETIDVDAQLLLH